MAWNWTQAAWPRFTYDPQALEALERHFLLSSGEILGTVKHIDDDQHSLLRIELLTDEAIKTSQIEGEILDRDSVQSSLRRQFGLDGGPQSHRPQEQGVAELMANVYATFADPLTDAVLFRWHDMLMSGNRTLDNIGAYRTHEDAMQIVSGRLDKPTIHFEAPPSPAIPSEMASYIAWYNSSVGDHSARLPALTRAGIGHIYFESIHPFEDGNGRLGRALAEKSLAQDLGHPSLIALAFTIEQDRKAYYDQLARHQQTLDITGWLVYFAETVLQAQQTTLDRVAFYLAKTRFYDRFRDRLNDRQAKTIARMFREGPAGFRGGLSAENYIAITQTSRATATRDLQDLVEAGALIRTGERRHTRYALALD